MVAQLISGVETSKHLLSDVAEKIKRQKQEDPSFASVLAIVQVGNRPDSNVYIGAKIKKAAEVGAEGKLVKLPDTITQEELEAEIDKLNKDDNVDGIIVQLPLDCKEAVDADAVIDKIHPLKDVDGLTRENAGRLMRGELSRTIFPCTPHGCLYLVQKATGDNNYVVGKNVVVLGRSKIVGAPAAALFLWHHGTVTICHSKTRNIKEHCLKADILVVAIGKKHFVKGDWIKPGAVVIDCGINVEEATEPGKKNKLFGDVEFEEAKKVASYITPVPGGVGPMTVAMLIRNTYEQAVARRLHQKAALN
ncbi:Dauer or Aging adult Overexpression [Trichostrongylus colubriformis]|uniref:C-1-tetrahydrofolate synthase, cytoplasmic n=1 Tax=Trichostrongylus colubriformis TaxID=6319 RepID=A0AAN8IED6_TRICO